MPAELWLSVEKLELLTWSELTAAEKAAAQREKNTKGRVTKYKK